MDNAFKHHKKINNEGSALVSVIMVACILSMIATTLLFVTVRNYKARQIEYQSKQNFYESEKMLDELKSILTEDCAYACKEAYSEVMFEYINMSSEARQLMYNQRFVDYFYDIWNERSIDRDCAKTLQSVVGSDYEGYIEKADIFQFENNAGYVVFPGITVSASTVDGYYTRITTDIRIEAPKLDWANGEGNSEPRTINMEDYVSYVNWKRD